jgi:hypothetical protein
MANSQTRRRGPSKSDARASAAAAERRLAELRAGRERIATQIKALTHFLYLLGGITTGIELAEQANRTSKSSPLTMTPEQIAQDKARINQSVRDVRAGLDELEARFRSTLSLQTYYHFVAGAATIGRNAESQAAANRFDQAGRSLIKVADQLTEALLALH